MRLSEELKDLRELLRLLEVMAAANDPPKELIEGSLSRYVAAKDAVLRKLKEIQGKR